ncbi:helix-turn-helix domain-containing protein [Streptomyces sp. NBC_00006]|uniref:helix-turn-helix transcriptional regulator n=1 Tax=Streptomyces sp. NBC_00006 TaxID=2975619 RepID=UPI00338FD149
MYLMTPAETAEYLRVSSFTLRNWRYQGEGPPFVKLGKCVRYLASDVRDWVESEGH